jgi:hypothetical protein
MHFPLNSLTSFLSYFSSIAGRSKAGFQLEQHDNVLPKFLVELIPHQVLGKHLAFKFSVFSNIEEIILICLL